MGIVLGAGGVLGGAWMVGGLAALNRVTGWDPRQAECLVGTSAGALFAALLGAGVSPSGLLPPGPGGAETEPKWILHELVLESSYRPERWLPRAVPGSWGLALAGMLQIPSPSSLLRMLSGLAPTGRVSPDPISRTVRRAAPIGWPRHPDCRIVATDYGSGQRVVFGKPGAPQADLAQAVAASCAIPGFFKPVAIDGRRYVDGGLHSVCNLDLLDADDVDVVICFSAMTPRQGLDGSSPLERAIHALFSGAAKQLRQQADVLIRRGVDVVVIEPTARDRAAMGSNLMEARRWNIVLQTALTTVAGQLRRRRINAKLGALATAA